MKGIRILLVDNHELVRRGVRSMLEQKEDIEIVGECSSAEKALSKMTSLHQDIVLMGTQMPGMNGIEAIRSLKRNSLDYGGDVIILADSLDYRAESLEAGAASYLLKDIASAELVQVIRQVYRDRHLSEERDGFIEEVVELVVPSPANAAQLLRFMCQLAEVLHEHYQAFASIVCTVGSWDHGTVITIALRPTMFSSLLIRLANMAEVEKIEEKPLQKGLSSSFPKKFELLPGSSPTPSKRIQVTLKEADMARQELATV